MRGYFALLLTHVAVPWRVSASGIGSLCRPKNVPVFLFVCIHQFGQLHRRQKHYSRHHGRTRTSPLHFTYNISGSTTSTPQSVAHYLQIDYFISTIAATEAAVQYHLVVTCFSKLRHTINVSCYVDRSNTCTTIIDRYAVWQRYNCKTW